VVGAARPCAGQLSADLDGLKHRAGLGVWCGAAASTFRRSVIRVEGQCLFTTMPVCRVIRLVPCDLLNKCVVCTTLHRCTPGRDIGIRESKTAVLHEIPILLLYSAVSQDVPDRDKWLDAHLDIQTPIPDFGLTFAIRSPLNFIALRVNVSTIGSRALSEIFSALVLSSTSSNAFTISGSKLFIAEKLHIAAVC
jgi:hypothetical protein